MIQKADQLPLNDFQRDAREDAAVRLERRELIVSLSRALSDMESGRGMGSEEVKAELDHL